MAKMMRNVTGGGCKCCNSWDEIAFRSRDNREVEREVSEWFDRATRIIWIEENRTDTDGPFPPLFRDELA